MSKTTFSQTCPKSIFQHVGPYSKASRPNSGGGSGRGHGHGHGHCHGHGHGAPLRGAQGRAPSPGCRAEILKKFTGKSVPENYVVFLSKTTDLVERIRMQLFLSKIDRRTLELWHFFQSFILYGFCLYFNFWSMPSLIGWWQVLIK